MHVAAAFRLSRYRLKRPHCKQVCHHCAESWSEARLRDEAQLEFSEANDVVAALPIPTRNVEKIGLKERKKKRKPVQRLKIDWMIVFATLL